MTPEDQIDALRRQIATLREWHDRAKDLWGVVTYSSRIKKLEV
jgi:hypothetical protein